VNNGVKLVGKMTNRVKGQRGCVVRKGSKYFIKFRGPDGKQKMQGNSPGHGFRNHQEAQDRLHEVLAEVNRGDYIGSKSITFAPFAEQWIHDRISIRGSTVSAYGSLIRQNLVPHLGKLKVHDIQLHHVQALVSKLAGSLSVKSLRNVMTLLRVMLVGRNGPSAVKLGYIRHDPTSGVELPHKKHGGVLLATPDQVRALINIAQDRAKESKCAEVGHAMILLDAFTGLRRGELLALQFANIDWFAAEIMVKQSISKFKSDDDVHKWSWKLGPTKNGRTRRVGVGERILLLLAELKQRAVDKEGFIFTPESAGLTRSALAFITPDYFNDSIYAPIAKAAELAQIRFHDLRHFFASMLIAQGETAKYVCDQLGHSSIQVTFDTYGHLFPQSRREAASRLENAMFDARKDQLVENLVEKADHKTNAGSRGKRPN
jgi:integrase